MVLKSGDFSYELRRHDMALDTQKQLRQEFLHTLLEATFPLKKKSADPEVALEALIDAARMLGEHLEKELAEIRVEETD
jgi:hypothetical protein